MTKFMNLLGIKSLLFFIQNRLNQRPNLRLIFVNIGWLSIDRIIRMGVGLIVSVWVARYLGPAQYGLFNYAVAFTFLFGGIANMGLDQIVVRDIVREPSQTNEIIGTAFYLKLLGGVIVVVSALTIMSMVRPHDILTMALVGITVAGMIFQSFDVIDLWFQSQVQSKYVVYAKNSAFLFAAFLRIIMILTGAPLVAFALVGLAEVILGACGLIYFYRHLSLRLLDWRMSLKCAKKILHDCWPLILSGTAIMIYLKIDMVMLGGMVGDQAVGIYAAATRVSEVWYFIPVIVVSSMLPSIIETKKISEELYYLKLQKLFDLMAGMALVIAILMTFFADMIIRILYKANYAGAGPILAIHIWAVPFVFLGVAQSSWDIAENLTSLAMRRTLIGAVINVVLNFVLIPHYSGFGAAIATVVAYAFSGCLANLIDNRTIRIFVLQVKSLLLVKYLFRTH